MKIQAINTPKGNIATITALNTPTTSITKNAFRIELLPPKKTTAR